jgi:hypothetical protein
MVLVLHDLTSWRMIRILQILPGNRQDMGPNLDVPFGLEESSVTDVIAAPDLAAIKQRQQATWASQNGR